VLFLEQYGSGSSQIRPPESEPFWVAARGCFCLGGPRCASSLGGALPERRPGPAFPSRPCDSTLCRHHHFRVERFVVLVLRRHANWASPVSMPPLSATSMRCWRCACINSRDGPKSVLDPIGALLRSIRRRGRDADGRHLHSMLRPGRGGRGRRSSRD